MNKFLTFQYGSLMLLILISISLFAQTPSDKIIPPPPTAASLGKYADIPVSYYTGIPNISIPIFNIESGTAKLPLDLNYHSSGIKVEEEASWVGLGWSLNAGGVITRTVRGTDDLKAITGFPVNKHPSTIDDLTNTYSPNSDPAIASADWEYFRRVGAGMTDGEPDLFYFNFAGKSGKFCLDQQLVGGKFRPVLISKDALKIEAIGTNQLSIVWRITAEDGTQYEFNEKEQTRNFTGSSTASEQDAIMNTNTGGEYFISAWYLSKVIFPNGRSVSFEYKTANSTEGATQSVVSVSEERTELTHTDIQGNGGCVDCSSFTNFRYYTSSRKVNYDVYLSRIVFDEGKIEFLTSGREDIQNQFSGASMQVAQKLDAIKIFVKSGTTYQLIKDFILQFDYFNNMSSSPYFDKRLRLTGLKEGNGTSYLPAYEFSYVRPKNFINGKGIIQGDMPSKDSKSQDHWGYFNGKNNNSIRYEKFNIYTGTLVPPADIKFMDGSTKSFAGADRNSDAEFAKVGLLSKIIFPYGAVSEFEYDLNDYLSSERVVNEVEESHTVEKFGPKTGEVSNNFEKTISFAEPTNVVLNASVMCYDIISGVPCFTQTQSSYRAVFSRIISVGNTPQYSYSFDFTLTKDKQFASASLNVLLPPGTYKIETFGYDGYQARLKIQWTVSSGSEVIESNKNGGGLRIARISRTDGVNVYNQLFRYRDINHDTKSSGVLMNKPNYIYHHMSAGSNSCAVFSCRFATRSSYSNAPLGSGAQGNVVGYSTVTVYDDENSSNGKTIYRFRNKPEYTSSPVYPNLPTSIPNDNGLVNAKRQYLKVGNNYQIVQEDTFFYESKLSERKIIKGVKVYGKSDPAWLIRPQTKFYDVVSEWWCPVGETTKTYDKSDPSKVTVVVNKYFFDNPVHFQKTRTLIENSDGSKEITLTTYPDDYASGTVFIDNMKTNHLIAYPIEQVRYKEVGTTRTILSGQITKYLAGGKGQVDQVLELEAPQPIALSAFKFSNRATGQLPPTGTATAFAPHGSYRTALTYSGYDSYGNPQQVTPADGPPTVYLWGYGGQYPVAEIRNATFAEVVTALGGTATANTVFANLNSSTVAESYIRNTLGGLRNHAATTKSQTGIYTYRPLMGMGSATDASGRTTYYSYDGFGRLKDVKNTQQQVTEGYQYNYRNQ